MAKRSILFFALAAVLLCAYPTLFAGEHFRATFTNGTLFEIVQIRMDLETPNGIRRDRTRTCLPQGRDYSIGVAGAIKLLAIRVDVVDARFDFLDLSGLDMHPEMELIISYDSEGLWLRQLDPDGLPRQVRGTVIEYVTNANAANAIPMDRAMTAESSADIRQIVADQVAATLAWYDESGDSTGVSRPAGLDGTLFEDVDGSLVFPVEWHDVVGVGRSLRLRRDADAVAVSLTVRLFDNTLEDMVADLGESGLRPWRMNLEHWIAGDDVDVVYHDAGMDAGAAMADIVEKCAVTRGDKSLRDLTALFVDGETYNAAATGEEVGRRRVVVLRCSPATLEAVFLPDASAMF